MTLRQKTLNDGTKVRLVSFAAYSGWHPPMTYLMYSVNVTRPFERTEHRDFARNEQDAIADYEAMNDDKIMFEEQLLADITNYTK